VSLAAVGVVLCCVVIICVIQSTGGGYEGKKSTDNGTKHGSLSELGTKLSNPLSDVWALFTEFDLNWSRGDLSNDDTATILGLRAVIDF
jgi:hypothetical protein